MTILPTPQVLVLLAPLALLVTAGCAGPTPCSADEGILVFSAQTCIIIHDPPKPRPPLPPTR